MPNEKLCAEGHVIGENEEVCPRCGGLPVSFADGSPLPVAVEQPADEESGEENGENAGENDGKEPGESTGDESGNDSEPLVDEEGPKDAGEATPSEPTGTGEYPTVDNGTTSPVEEDAGEGKEA